MYLVSKQSFHFPFSGISAVSVIKLVLELADLDDV